MKSSPSPTPASADANRFHLPYLLAVAALMSALLWSLTAQDPWGWVLPRYVGIEIDQQLYRVPERRLGQLTQTRPDWLDEAEGLALERLSQGVDRELDLLFERVHGRVPEFADWYYSMTGVSLRLAASVPNPFWSKRRDFLTEAVSERLFPQDRWEAELDALDHAVGEHARRELAGLEGQWLAWLARELAAYRRDAPLPGGETPVSFDERLHAELHGMLSTDRIGVHLSAGLGAGALLARGAIVRINARAASARAAARLAGRGAAGSSSVACGFTGPFAIACGVVVFTGTILGTEWALLQLDETLNRPDLERALHGSVDALRDSMTEEYARPFVALFETNLDKLTTGIQGSLRPVDHLRRSPPTEGEKLK